MFNKEFLLKSICLFLLFCVFFCSETASAKNHAKLSFCLDDNGDLKMDFSPENGLDLGKLTESEKKLFRVNLENRTTKKIVFESLRSPCPCLEFDNIVEELGPGDKNTLVLVLDGSGYSGTFSKFIHLGCSFNGGALKSFFLPVKFQVLATDSDDLCIETSVTAEEMKTENAGKQDQIVYYDYDKIKHGDRKQLENAAKNGIWLFGTRDCPVCNHLKKNVLPKLRANPDTFAIVTVNLDIRENFLLLLKIEEKIGVKGEKSPVMYWNGRLFYGAEEIKNISANFANSDFSEGKHGSGVLAEIIECGRASNASEERRLLEKKASEISLGLILFAGLADGLNPCVFSTLIFFVTLLSSAKVGRQKVFAIGCVFCFASFVSYLAIGFGGLNFLRFFSVGGFFSKGVKYLTCGALAVLAFLSFRDAFRFRASGDSSVVTAQLPGKIKSMIHRIMKFGLSYRFLVPGIFVVGMAVTGLETICTGQVYVPTLVYISRDNGAEMKALSYLVLYNLAFTMPLLGVFLALCAGRNAFERIELGRNWVFWGKLVMGLFFVTLLIAMLSPKLFQR